MKALAFFLGASLLAAPPAPPDLSGVIRIAGNPELQQRVAHWSGEFQRRHPGVRFAVHLTGSDTGMAALYTGQADLALLGRIPTASEVQAFEWIFRYPPAQLEVLTGSLDRPGRSPALVIFVRRDNPLRAVSLAQLEKIFGAGPAAAPAAGRTWEQLGLGGEWAGRPIHLYAPDAISGTGRFFRRVVLHDSRMMNWEQMTEFTDSPGAATHDAGRKILAALASDRFGLAVATLGFPNAEVRAVALISTPAATPIAASADTLVARTYPLARGVTVCFNRAPGSLPDPLVREFLRFVLSPAGQGVQDDGYLPLAADAAARETDKLH